MRAALTLIVAGGLAAGIGLPTVAGGSSETGPLITGRGVGGLALGRSYEFLRAQRLVGKARAGCPLAPTEQKTARLRSPLKGFATFAQRPGDLELIGITVTGGARTARGIGVGSTARQALRLYPSARRNTATRGTFGVDLIQVHVRRRKAFSFVVRASTSRITQIDVPITRFCD